MHVQASLTRKREPMTSSTRDLRNSVFATLGMLANAATPFLRSVRGRWGLAIEEAQRSYPGDELIPKPRRCWTHGIEIAAGAADVWPWVAQIGQDKAGFYSYQYLENLAGCRTQSSETLVPAWQDLKVGQRFSLHPKVPPLVIGALQPGRWFVVTDVEPQTNALAHISWLLFVEPLGPTRCRFISRVRTRPDRTMRLTYGPWLMESVATVMNRAMLRGIKRRAEGTTLPAAKTTAGRATRLRRLWRAG